MFLNSLLLAPFNPRQIPNLVLWLDGNDPAGTGIQPADSSAVATWVDKSGLGYNFPQGTGANQALFKQNGFNNKGGLLFDGTNDYYELGYTADLNQTNIALFIVHTNQVLDTNFRSPFSNRGVAGANGYGLTYYRYPSNDPQASKLSYFCNQGTASANSIFGPAAVASNSTAYISALSVSAGVGTMYVNNVSQGTANLVGNAGFATPPTRIGAGRTESTATFFHSGYILETLMYKVAPSADNQLRIARYLANKWGISI